MALKLFTKYMALVTGILIIVVLAFWGGYNIVEYMLNNWKLETIFVASVLVFFFILFKLWRWIERY